MVSVTPSLPPFVGGNPLSQAAPSVEEKLVLQPSLTLLVFILLPCVVLLFLINCFLLFYRLPVLPLKKRAKRRGGGSRGNNPPYRNEARHNNWPGPGCPDKSTYDSYCAAISQGLEATLALGESAHASCDRLQSTREWCHKQNETPVRPYCLHPPRASPMPCFLSGSPSMCQERVISWNEVEDGGGGGGISYSEQESRQNAAPPNTPAAPQMVPGVKNCNKTSTQRKPLGAPFTPLGSVLFDHASSIPPDDLPTRFSANSSFLGPGLDSDFGVSAGISLHILSSDSDSCSQSWASGMEWDYYDPCYMRKNRLRRENRHNHQIPVICSKQYWV
ncbi:protein huluwa-like [Hyla sarda]|uniref:protein huluwa-like n=1 Tax=Hyla sarda TaxID=327740 RepID=UPI0024C3B67A|nr:protein huluwa-like [Hyla sarda]